MPGRMDAHKLPLSGKKLYLDLKGYGKHDIQILEQNLSLLGAVIENWFSSDVSIVVTSEGKREDYNGKKCFDSTNANLPLTPVSTSPIMSNGPTPEIVSKTIRMSNDEITRGKLMLTKAAQKHENSNAKVIERARQLKIGIVHIDKVQQFLDKKKDLIQRQRAVSAATKNAKESSLIASGVAVRKLRGPCLKFESRSRRYRPLYAEFDVFPAITAASSPCSQRGDRSKTVLPTARLDDCQPCSSRKDSLSAMTAARAVADNTPESSVSTRRLNTGRDLRCIPVPPRQTYCEICRCNYVDMKMHRKSKSHQDFINDESNFACIDKRISDNRLDVTSLMAKLRARAVAAGNSASTTCSASTVDSMASSREATDGSDVAIVTAMLEDASIPSPQSPVFATNVVAAADILQDVNVGTSLNNSVPYSFNGLQCTSGKDTEMSSRTCVANFCDRPATEIPVDEVMSNMECDFDGDDRDDEILLLNENADQHGDPLSEGTVVYEVEKGVLTEQFTSPPTAAVLVSSNCNVDSNKYASNQKDSSPPVLGANCADAVVRNDTNLPPPLLSPHFQSRRSVPSSSLFQPDAVPFQSSSKHEDATIVGCTDDRGCKMQALSNDDVVSPLSSVRDSRTRKAKALAEDAMLARRLTFAVENYSPCSSRMSRKRIRVRKNARQMIAERIDDTSENADFDPEKYYKQMMPQLDRYLRH